MRKRALVFNELQSVKGIPYTRQHILRMEKRGEFPQHFELSPKRIAWLESEIDEWIDARVAESRANTIPPARKLEEASVG
jgi:prophage regulatory protein